MNRKINIKWFMGSDQSRHKYVATVVLALRRWYRRRCTASGNKTDISRRSKITVSATAAVLPIGSVYNREARPGEFF